MASPWIDFTELKRQVSIRSVLGRYGFLDGLEEKKGGKLVGPCPIHGGKGKASFNVDLGKNVFNCFSHCGGGNVLDLVMKVEDCEIRDAGEKLAEWFGLEFERNPASTEKSAKVSQKNELDSVEQRRVETAHHIVEGWKQRQLRRQNATADHRADGDKINPPLKTPLKNLNQDHPYLVDRGLTVPTIKHFGLGYCSRGMMRGRVAIPIHDVEDVLVGYAGRAVDPKLAEEKGKYRLPSNEQGFYKSHLLFNLQRAKLEDNLGLVVVEGFFGAMKVHQAGFPNVVALMGSSLSEQQEQLLVESTDRIALMLDGDDAGTECKRDIWRRLVRKLYIRDIHLEDGEQPDGLSEDRIRELLS